MRRGGCLTLVRHALGKKAVRYAQETDNRKGNGNGDGKR